MQDTNPNLQNVSPHTDLGRQLRNEFVRGSETLHAADFTKIELRVLMAGLGLNWERNELD